MPDTERTSSFWWRRTLLLITPVSQKRQSVLAMIMAKGQVSDSRFERTSWSSSGKPDFFDSDVSQKGVSLHETSFGGFMRSYKYCCMSRVGIDRMKRMNARSWRIGRFRIFQWRERCVGRGNSCFRGSLFFLFDCGVWKGRALLTR